MRREDKLAELGLTAKALIELSVEKPSIFTQKVVFDKLFLAYKKLFKEENENATTSTD